MRAIDALKWSWEHRKLMGPVTLFAGIGMFGLVSYSVAEAKNNPVPTAVTEGESHSGEAGHGNVPQHIGGLVCSGTTVKRDGKFQELTVSTNRPAPDNAYLYFTYHTAKGETHHGSGASGEAHTTLMRSHGEVDGLTNVTITTGTESVACPPWHASHAQS